jgi:UDP-2,3-diacylglucosamine hydrolase
VPPIHELKAEPSWLSVEFISDLHLSESQPRTVAAWGDYLRSSQADAIFILGDLFEAWVGDDARQAGRFEQMAADLLAQATQQRSIGFMVGNRDFLLGTDMLQASGMSALPDPTVLAAFDRRVLLTHGDALCLSDTAYQAFRSQVRSEAWRAQCLRLPLAERERLARQMRDASKSGKQRKPVADWSDVDADTAVQWLRAAGSDVMVHGHTHRPGSELLAPGFTRHVLSDWDCDVDAEPRRAQVLRLTREGFARIDLLP